MTERLQLAAELWLPLDVVTQKTAFLGTSGGGKTFAASKLAELMLAAHAQVIVLDPVGVWYGLRVGRGGKGPGYEIPVLGGIHGDIPLEPGAGALVADTIVDTGTSAVLDVSMLRKGQRKQFATDFAEQLFHRKKSQRSPLHLFIEEAQTFLPQFKGNDEARMVGAFEDLTKIGRNFGIGHSLISQRPQAVNKDALNQVGTLFVFRTIAKQERRAIQDWIVEHDVQASIDRLPKLKTGECFVWSPSWLGRFELIHIDPRSTYDASATPKVGTAAPSVKLAKVDLAKLEASMKDVVERAAAEDPRALRKRIGELERKVQNAEEAYLRLYGAQHEPQRVEVPLLQPNELETLSGFVDRITELQGSMRDAFDRLVTLTHQVHRDHAGAYNVRGGSGERGRPAASATIPSPSTAPHPSAPARANDPLGGRARARQPASMNGNGKLTKGELAVLHALLENHGRPTMARKAALVAGYSVRSSTFRNILSGLRTKGLITGGRDGLRVTEDGHRSGGGHVCLPSDLRAFWLDRVGRQSTPGRVLAELLGNWPAAVAREDLARRSGSSPESSTYRNALSHLRTLELIEGSAELRVVDDLGAGA